MSKCHGKNCPCSLSTRHEWFIAYCDLRDRMVNTSRPEGETRWQPMATAPKDRPILTGLIKDGRLWRGEIGKWGGLSFYDLTGSTSLHWATHWAEVLPLPAVPAGDRASSPPQGPPGDGQ